MAELNRVEYLRPIEEAKLSSAERKQYQKDCKNIRKAMRALVAYQDSNIDIYGEHKDSVTSLAGNYGLSKDLSLFNRQILRYFVGDSYYQSMIQPKYIAKADYDSASPSDKKYLDKVYSPIDYFDTPMLYHFYKFREAFIKEDKRQRLAWYAGKEKKATLEQVLSRARESYFGKPNAQNMYFEPKDLVLSSEPIASYTNITRRQDKYKDTAQFADEVTVLDEIKPAIVEYMISYAEKTKPDYKKETSALAPSYYISAGNYLKKCIFTKPAKEYMLGLYGKTFSDEEKARLDSIINESNSKATSVGDSNTPNKSTTVVFTAKPKEMAQTPLDPSFVDNSREPQS